MKNSFGEDPTNDTVFTVTCSETTASWFNHCGDGRVDTLIDDFENPSLWSDCCQGAGVPSPTLTKTEGCSGSSLVIDYDLTKNARLSEGWLVISRSFRPPLDLRAYTHLRIAVRGSDREAHHNFQIKLADGSGRLYWVVAESVTDLPVWRVVYIDLREFTCFGDPQTACYNPPPLDTSAIARIELALARCVRLRDGTEEECEPGRGRAVFFVDELAAVDLRPGAKHRLVQTGFEAVVASPDLRASTARAIKDHQDGSDLVPAWFQESSPNYNTYAQALSLLVFVEEHGRTKEAAYQDAANRLASRLIALQIPASRVNAGAWHTAYRRDGSRIVPLEPCTGDEASIQDRDRCSWIGNTAWAVIALARLKKSELYANPAELDAAIDRAASWMARQMGRIAEYPDLVTVGLEGNISAYFGLLAAGRMSEARWLGDRLYATGWDAEEKRMKIGAGPSDYGTAMDTAGSWGVTFLRCLGKEGEALLSQGFAATVLRMTSFDARVDGYGDIAGPWTMTVEFGAQGAAAGIRDATYIMQHLYRLEAPDGSFPGSTDDWFGGTVAPWTTRMTGVAPTAWVYFAQQGDPLLQLCVESVVGACSRSEVSSFRSPRAPTP
jgi:hypothetical protein